jgi:hypothetical protein
MLMIFIIYFYMVTCTYWALVALRTPSNFSERLLVLRDDISPYQCFGYYVDDVTEEDLAQSPLQPIQ